MGKLKFVFLIFIALLINSALLAYSSDPKEFVGELVNDAIDTLSDKSLSKEEKAKFVEKMALENVDIKALSLYTLGELRKSTKKKKLISIKLLLKNILKSLTSRLTDYSDSKFDIIDSEQKSSSYTIVNSKVFPEDGSPQIKIDWRIYTKNLKSL